jgi:leucyl aminopeptidase
MNINLEKGDFLDVGCDLLIVSQFENGGLSHAGTRLDKALDGALSALIKKDRFQGRKGERLVFPTFGKLKAHKVALIGLGPRQKMLADTVRWIGGCMMKVARDAKAKKVVTVLHGAGVGGLDAGQAAQTLGEGMLLGAYRFHTYHGTAAKEHASLNDVTEVMIVEEDRTKVKPAVAGFASARCVADAVMLTRDLVNTPSLDMTPLRLAEVAKSLATRGSGIRCTILDKAKMEKLGMGAALAVAAGSDHPPVGVHLTYTPKKRAKKRVAVIGKAVTFDSGGLNIKPGDNMSSMKMDMAGAAAVIGLFKMLPTLNLPIEVHGIFLGVENMPSGRSYRPGDVVRAMNGMTIEILNTDAEGRVTLADAISYTVKKVKPDAMVDLATLTGAAIVALGEDITPVMGNDKALVKSILGAAKEAGEDMWELPLFAAYDESINSKIADMNNTGGRAAGCIKAGLFIQRFANGIPWVHLDIAGPAYAEKEVRPDVPYGGTGAGVRTLAKWLEEMA